MSSNYLLMRNWESFQTFLGKKRIFFIGNETENGSQIQQIDRYIHDPRTQISIEKIQLVGPL